MKSLGKYQVKERIGHGGMGSVYRAHDPIIGRDVAIKIIREQILNVPEVKTRFYREAKSAGRLSHENIMVIHDVGEQDGQPFIVMEYLPGTDLRQMLDEGVDLPLGDKLRIALQICAGLKYAHEHGVVHRDIKPENIRVLPGRKVKILDFGIARLGDETVSITRASIGTPKYMSPEQIKSEPIDQRSDVFSFGVLLYELLAGLNPFSGSNVSSISYKIVHQDPEPIPVGQGRMAEDLRSIVMTCLAKDREERYQDFGAVIADLNRSMTHGTVSTEESSAKDEVSNGISWGTWGAAALIVAAIAAGSVFFAGSRPTDNPAPVPTEVTRDDQVSSATPDELDASVETGRERVMEAKRRADNLSPDIAENSSYVEATTVLGAGSEAAATGTEQGLRDAIDHFRDAATLFDEAVESHERSLTERERNAVNDIRRRLTNAVPGIVNTSTYRDAESARNEGDAFFQDGSFEDARRSYTRASNLYGTARDSYRPPAQTDTDTELRRQAVAARTRMQSLEQDVASDRGSGQLDALFREADTHREAAEDAMADNQYQDARNEFEAAEDGYRSISEQVQSLRNAESEALGRADSQNDAMLSAKLTVSEPQMQTDQYERALTAENSGRSAYDDARFEEAATLFSEAARLYNDASGVDIPVEETMSFAEQATQAMAAIARRTETQFANESPDGLEAISPFFSSSEWSNFFGIAHDVDAKVEPTDIQTSGERATFSVVIRLSFLNNTDRRMNNTLRQRWMIERNQNAWSVVDVESVN